MKFKIGVEQSIYILLILNRIPLGYTITSDSISKRLKLSKGYMQRLMPKLVHEGLIHSSPGQSGGFSLAIPLCEIDLSDIFNAVEGKGSLFNETNLLSLMTGDNVDPKQCSLKVVMETIEDTWRKLMESVNLAELEKKIEQEYDTTDIDKWINSVISK